MKSYRAETRIASEKEPFTIFSEVILKVFEEFSDGFLILNRHREIIFFNEVLLRLTGWKSKDILAGGSSSPA